LGSPRKREDLSPYHCTTLELCKVFANSKHRVEILKGLLAFREKITSHGILKGFQWIDGSFTENIELTENRPPNDLDLVTFFEGINQELVEKIQTNFEAFLKPQVSKNEYKLDHYPFDYTYKPDVTVEYTRYWIQLFTHNRKGIWKGILRLELNTPKIDKLALEYLEELVL
jgi:hypothetical protein